MGSIILDMSRSSSLRPHRLPWFISVRFNIWYVHLNDANFSVIDLCWVCLLQDHCWYVAKLSLSSANRLSLLACQIIPLEGMRRVDKLAMALSNVGQRVISQLVEFPAISRNAAIQPDQDTPR